MVESCDAGSLPFVGDFQKYLRGAADYSHTVNDSVDFFEKKAVEGFLHKAEAGIQVPNYPQYRDMTQMFLDMIEGVEKANGGYIETANLTLKQGKGRIAEVSAIENHGPELEEKLQAPFNLRICITGPYTLSSLYAYKDRATFTRLGTVLSEIVGANIISSKRGKVQLFSIDEPAFGFVDDPLLDRGSEGRENLLKAWENMAQRINANGAQSCLHLHNTSDELFWEIKPLQVIETHAGDPFYEDKRTKHKLESTDKFLKASLGITDFDELIRRHWVSSSRGQLNETSLSEKVAESWKELKHGNIDPTVFLEDSDLMMKRLVAAGERFGSHRILYAGPECGMKGFPTYESALECLRRVAQTTKNYSHKSS